MILAEVPGVAHGILETLKKNFEFGKKIRIFKNKNFEFLKEKNRIFLAYVTAGYFRVISELFQGYFRVIYFRVISGLFQNVTAGYFRVP